MLLPLDQTRYTTLKGLPCCTRQVSRASVRSGRGFDDCEPAVSRDWTDEEEWKIKAEKEPGPRPEPVWSQAVRSTQCVLVTSSSLFPEHRPLLW